MKRLNFLVSLVAFTAAFLPASAQDGSAGSYKAEYERQVRYVGAGGVGVETIINRWEAATPDDPEVHLARFTYKLTRARDDSRVVAVDASTYLGNSPIFTLKDSLGNDVNYFEEVVFDDELFSDAIKAIDRAIELRPEETSYRFYKITAILDYEKESPDLAASSILGMIDDYVKGHDSWTYAGEPLDEETFCLGIVEYCYVLFNIASPSGYRYFLQISEKMNRIFPDDTVFINNMGAYWQVAGKNNRKAAKYYKKSLKLDPEDYVATTNMRIIQSSQSRKGRSSK